MMYDMYSTADEIKNGDPKIAIMPIGATEQHGPHLPVYTDTMIADAMAEGMAQRMDDAYRLPTLPISTSMEHRGKKGSVWVSSRALYDFMESMLDSLHYQGFEKVILLFTHGGILFTEAFVREMNMRFEDRMQIVMVRQNAPSMQHLKPDVYQSEMTIHACEEETSLLLHRYPDTVRTELIEDCVPDVPNEYMNHRPIFHYSKNGVWGEPSHATAEKGEQVLEFMIDSCIKQAQIQFDSF